jgi:glucose-1-phosphate cytidylyltransferase
MKVVLFCGGLGMRLREVAENVPKPMVPIGYRPILWHVMKYYAHFGHKDFLLCLGYRSDVIKKYFRDYDECISNDFILSSGGKQLELLSSDIHDWKITFADTGTNCNIGERLKAVEKYLDGEEEFLANYSDGLTDLPLPEQIAAFRKDDKIASFVCVKPNLSYHLVSVGETGEVTSIQDMNRSDIRINGGYFIFKNSIFKYMRDGEELVHEPFQRLIQEQRLHAYKYDGFWGCMDTFKDKQMLDDLYSRGNAPWEIWKNSQATKAGPVAANTEQPSRVPSKRVAWSR